MRKVILDRVVGGVVLLTVMAGAALLFASAGRPLDGALPAQPSLPIRPCAVTVESLIAAPPSFPPVHGGDEGGGPVDGGDEGGGPVDGGERSVALTLRNEGEAPVSVQGVELSWPAANGALMEVRLDNRVLWRGWESSSPAVVGTLAATVASPALGQGSTATLTLLFAQSPVAQGPYVVVVAFDGGCRAAYSTRLPLLACGQAVEKSRVRDNVAEFTVHNRSDRPATLRLVQLAWPLVTNGALQKLTLNRTVVWAGVVSNSPATVLLRPEPQTRIEPGGSLRLGLEFAAEAAQSPYTLAVFFESGCLAGWSGQSRAGICSLSPEILEVEGNTLWLGLHNQAELPALLAGLEVFWPQRVNRTLRELRLDNVTLWRGEATENPAIVAPGTDLTTAVGPVISPGQSRRLGLVFGGEAAAGPYTVVAAMAQGCQAVASTRAVAPSCKVEAEDFVTSGSEVRLALHNPGPAPATVGRLQVYWPVEENQALLEVRLGERVFWRGRATTSPSTVEGLTTTALSLKPGDTLPLTLVFATRAVAERHYIILLNFAEGCKAFFSTRVVQEACQVDVKGLKVEDGAVQVSLHNSGPVTAEAMALELDWPVGRNGPLLSLALDGRTVWQGVLRESPALVKVDSDVMSPPKLPPDGQAVLSLTFEAADPAPAPYTLSVTFAGGCRAFFTNAVTATPSRLSRFEGPIRDLPDALIGPWAVGETVVEVDERTVVTPHNVEPAIGDWAQVTAQGRTDGTLLALRLNVTPGVKRREVEFQGLIEELLETNHVIVAGQTVLSDANTAVTGLLAVGQVAHVWGFLTPDGTVMATRVVVESPTAKAGRTEFEGPIERFSTDFPGSWVIGGITLTVEASGVVTGIPRLGAIAEVAAVQRGTGELVAQSIQIRGPAVTDLAAPLRGIIQALPESSLLGDWRVVVGDDAVPLIVKVDANTFVDESRGRVRVGTHITLTVKAVEGGQRAIRITVLR